MIEEAAGILRITTPLPFRPKTVAAYLVRLDSDGWMLVDGGVDSDDAWEALEAGVLNVTHWSGLRLHLVTHMHVDHIGLARRVRDASSVPLAIGVLDGERAAHAAANPAEEDHYREALLRGAGAPDSVCDRVIDRRQRAGPDDSFVSPDHLLPLSDVRLPGAPEWTVIWTPGHTAGHVSLFRERDEVLIAGDAVLPTISPTVGVNRQREDPVADYHRSLDRLENLEPRTIFPGHGDPMEGTARIEALSVELGSESERVFGLLKANPESAWYLSGERYSGRELPFPLRVNALRETLAHLEHLTRSGAAEKTEEGGVFRYSRA